MSSFEHYMKTLEEGEDGRIVNENREYNFIDYSRLKKAYPIAKDLQADIIEYEGCPLTLVYVKWLTDFLETAFLGDKMNTGVHRV